MKKTIENTQPNSEKNRRADRVAKYLVKSWYSFWIFFETQRVQINAANRKILHVFYKYKPILK
jgi:hypothetical protein